MSFSIKGTAMCGPAFFGNCFKVLEAIAIASSRTSYNHPRFAVSDRYPRVTHVGLRASERGTCCAHKPRKLSPVHFGHPARNSVLLPLLPLRVPQEDWPFPKMTQRGAVFLASFAALLLGCGLGLFAYRKVSCSSCMLAKVSITLGLTGCNQVFVRLLLLHQQQPPSTSAAAMKMFSETCRAR